MSEPKPSGLILAGGQSRRFGSDKATYPVGDRRMIDHVVATVRPVVGQLLVSVQTERSALRDLADRVVADLYPGRGPMAGLHAGLHASQSPWMLAVACDMPFLTTASLETLLSARFDGLSAVIAVSSDGRRHPLCACYHRSVLAQIERSLSSDDLSMHGLLSRLDVVNVVLPESDLKNVNAPSDLAT